MLSKVSLSFAAGCFGALVNSLVLWLCGSWGLTTALGVKLAPAFTLPWLYPRLVWGGLWGWLFLLPGPRRSLLVRGLMYSLAPTLVQLLWIFPYKARQGFLGLQLGALTPLVVLALNAVWGLAAAAWLKQTGFRSS